MWAKFWFESEYTVNGMSAIGIGFDGAETNCGMARILGILLMNGYGN